MLLSAHMCLDERHRQVRHARPYMATAAILRGFLGGFRRALGAVGNSTRNSRAGQNVRGPVGRREKVRLPNEIQAHKTQNPKNYANLVGIFHDYQNSRNLLKNIEKFMIYSTIDWPLHQANSTEICSDASEINPMRQTLQLINKHFLNTVWQTNFFLDTTLPIAV
ncbi:hypothetical protein [Caballeronia novacaledonica]|uniref:hypothetical protein n=1 Tax=Caballeronia novacaledonica TaxID=1544861 RepID=UPI0015E6DBB8|nr:hypothetical protein [Caballeronia novacaledonica]